MKVDVAVVGAGFSGLFAARLLHQAGRKTVVLEARQRPGGRIETVMHRTGVPLDLGGQWVGPQQRTVLRLARELGVERFPTYMAGEHLFCFRGLVRRFRGVVPPLSGRTGRAVKRALEVLDIMAAGLNPRTPWKHPQALPWDGMTVRTWLEQEVPDQDARAVVSLTLESVFACDPRELSLLHALFYIRSAGGLGPLLSTEGGAQQDRFVGGAQRIADAMALDSGPIRYGEPVRRIHHDAGGVKLETDTGCVFAHRAILAVPPAVAVRVDFQPPLSGLRDQLWQRTPMGSVIKCFAIYPTPWWRDRGLSGHAISDEGPVQAVFDATPASGSPGVLMGFFEGQEAREYARQGPAARRAALLECFVRYFGPEARAPLDVVDKDWSDDPWARGGYVGFLTPGAWTGFGHCWAAAAGRIHFAGAETATRWHGYMEGALLAGKRAASEVLRAEGWNATPDQAVGGREGVRDAGQLRVSQGGSKPTRRQRFDEATA